MTFHKRSTFAKPGCAAAHRRSDAWADEAGFVGGDDGLCSVA